MKSLGGEDVAQFLWEFLRTHCYWDIDPEDDSDFEEYAERWYQQAEDDGERNEEGENGTDKEEDNEGSNGDK